jgi:PHD/YefM family antitoxin component YafN of YafNO toxin-antitoxin module
MIDIKSIESLTDFKRNTNEHLKKLKKSRKPLVLTVNGKAELVVFDAVSFQKLLDKIEYAETVRDLREGIEQAERGEVVSAEDGFAQIAEKYGISY